MNGGAKKVYCTCGTPVAEIQDGVLVVRVKHHGEVHETRIIVAIVDNKRVLVVA